MYIYTRISKFAVECEINQVILCTAVFGNGGKIGGCTWKGSSHFCATAHTRMSLGFVL